MSYITHFIFVRDFFEHTKIYTRDNAHLMGDFKLNDKNTFTSFYYIKYTQVIGRCLISKSISFFLSLLSLMTGY